MKLYYSIGACSLVIRIVLNELKIPFETEAVNLMTKKTASHEDFLTINPKGAVPALILDNQEVLTENAVIQQYLVDHYNSTTLLPPVGDFKRYRALEWLNFITTELHKNCAPLFNPTLSEEIKKDIFKPILDKKLKFIEQQLQQNTYLLGNEFSLPDAYLFVILQWLPRLGIETNQYPAINHYQTKLKQRPSIQQSLQEEGLS
ncbi:MAG: Glutathione S-transferase GST-6.0 [Legionellaceae bacterium]